MQNNSYMELHNITKTYPGVVALDSVSFDLRPGEVHALVGENGAGKSTLIKVLAGAISPDSGTISIDGKDYASLTPLQAKELGIEVIYQEFNLLPALSVAENIYLTELRGKRMLVNKRDFERRAQELFDSLGITHISPKQLVQNLTPAGMQLVEIAKAISKPNTKIMIMDEPTAPLSNKEVDMLFDIIRKLKRDNISIIYISHRMEEIFGISDRVTILRDGHYIKTLETASTDRSQLIELMVGRKLNENFPERTSPVGEECVLRVENAAGGCVKGVSFELHRGEILGIGGLVGVGRTETIRMLFGADKLEAGTVYYEGKKVSVHHPADALGMGIALVPEDRKRQGVFLNFPIFHNVSMSRLKKLSTACVIRKKEEQQVAEHYKEILNIKAPSIATIVGGLSGGNQQKVALAKCLAAEPKVLILDEPTRGIDVGAKLEIYNMMRELCRQGMSIIMISSEMNELMGMSDRILVLCEGRTAGILDGKEATQERVLALASGVELKEQET